MAVMQLAQDGLEGLTLGNVARNLGMSHTAMTKRYDDLDDLLCDLWVQVGQPQIDRILTWVFAEVERLSDPTSVSDSAAPASPLNPVPASGSTALRMSS